MDDGVARILVLEFFETEEKRGDLCNLPVPRVVQSASPRSVPTAPCPCLPHLLE